MRFVKVKSVYVKIHGINDMTSFVKIASTVEGDVTCRKGRYVVDGKSIMGVMSLDISTGVTVEYPKSAEEFDLFISQFIPKSQVERA